MKGKIGTILDSTFTVFLSIPLLAFATAFALVALTIGLSVIPEWIQLTLLICTAIFVYQFKQITEQSDREIILRNVKTISYGMGIALFLVGIAGISTTDVQPGEALQTRDFATHTKNSIQQHIQTTMANIILFLPKAIALITAVSLVIVVPLRKHIEETETQ
ncbi:MAG: hypothetical protein OEZ58_00130 [Gammaproteobacteria bacterium]|nr:hypothetical protein [Gammaproteobacteria bacterium]